MSFIQHQERTDKMDSEVTFLCAGGLSLAVWNEGMCEKELWECVFLSANRSVCATPERITREQMCVLFLMEMALKIQKLMVRTAN